MQKTVYILLKTVVYKYLYIEYSNSLINIYFIISVGLWNNVMRM